MTGSPWLYVVLLGAAAIVYSLMLPKRKGTSTDASNSSSSQVEATMEHYMSEIERENLEIVELVSQVKMESRAQQLSFQEQVTELRTRLSESDRLYQAQDMKIKVLEQSLSTDKGIFIDPKKTEEIDDRKEQSNALATATHSVRDRYADLFELQYQGKSIDAIAKAMGMQRGEVQLILQLANKEEIFL